MTATSESGTRRARCAAFALLALSGCTPASRSARPERKPLTELAVDATAKPQPNAVKPAELAVACARGDVPSCDALDRAVADGNGGVSRDVYDTLVTACPRTAAACSVLGRMARDGVGVAKAPARAVAFFESACSGGEWWSCSSAGVMYEGRSGVPADTRKVRSLFEVGCTHEPRICVNLAAVFADGIGVRRDLDAAETILRRACDRGEAFVCRQLAALLDARKKPEGARAAHARACALDPARCGRIDVEKAR